MMEDKMYCSAEAAELKNQIQQVYWSGLCMSKLISQDSKLVETLSHICDLMLLNVIYVITCIPIITIGAATTALYTVSFRFGTDRENGIIRPFFQSFRDNFKQATVFWMLLLVVGADIALAVYLSYPQHGYLHYAFIPGIIVLVVIFLVGGYAFPLISQFYNRNKEVLRNAFLLGIGFWPRSLCIVLLNVLPAVLFLLHPAAFMYMGSVWFLLYFSVSSRLIVRLLHKVFAPYMVQEGDLQESEKS